VLLACTDALSGQHSELDVVAVPASGNSDPDMDRAVREQERAPSTQDIQITVPNWALNGLMSFSRMPGHCAGEFISEYAFYIRISEFR